MSSTLTYFFVVLETADHQLDFNHLEILNTTEGGYDSESDAEEETTSFKY